MTTPSDATRPASEPGDRRRTALIIGGIVVVVIVLGVLGAFLLRNDDDDVTAGDTTTSTTEPGTTSTAPTTSTTSTPSTTAAASSSTSSTPSGGVTDDESPSIVWPDPGSDLVYPTGPAAAEGFAVDLVGFTDPIIGAFQEGDSRSGEVEVQADASGPITTVFVRLMGDDHWYVIGAVTADIEVDEPTARATIAMPLVVSGRARAFEGTVQVAVVGRGSADRLGRGVVTGSGGGDLGPFSGQIDWTNSGADLGAVLFWTTSAEDGRVVQATVLPVGF